MSSLLTTYLNDLSTSNLSNSNKKLSFEEERLLHLTNMSSTARQIEDVTPKIFSFFENKEVPKLPSTPASSFSCFSFGQNSQSTKSNNFSFGSNSAVKSKNGLNFDDKISSIQQSLSAISNQPQSDFGVSSQKMMSEESRRIATLECVLSEVKGLKEKVSSLESCIVKLLLEELDVMKKNVTSTTGFKDSPQPVQNVFQSSSNSLFGSNNGGATRKLFSELSFKPTKVPENSSTSTISVFGSIPKPTLECATTGATALNTPFSATNAIEKQNHNETKTEASTQLNSDSS